MARLIALEWLKMRKHNFFWIGMGLYILLMLLVLGNIGNFNFSNSQGGAESTSSSFTSMGIYDSPQIWQNLTYLAGYFKIIPGFLLIFFITNEYSYRTVRQNIIDGLNKGEFYLSKIFTAVLFTLVSCLIVFAAVYIIAALHNDDLSRFFATVEYLGGYALEILFFFSFCTFSAFLFKRSAIAIIITLLYYFFAEPILANVIGDPWEYFLPTQPARELVKEPFSRLTNLDKLLGLDQLPGVQLRDAAFSLLYSVLFGIGGFAIFKYRDL